MEELYRAWRKDWWLKRLAQGEDEDPDADQGQESTHYQEFQEEVKQLAITATRKAILLENAENLRKQEGTDRHQKELMADVSYVMRKAIKRLIVPIEESEEEVEADRDQTQDQKVLPGEGRDLDLILGPRKSKLTVLHLPNLAIDTLPLVQSQGLDPGLQKRARHHDATQIADLPERNQRNTEVRAVVSVPIPAARRGPHQEIPVAATLGLHAAAQDQSKR
jgi:hypothetical protein